VKYAIKALPGRVIVEFDKPAEFFSKEAGIVIPEQFRVIERDIAKIVDLGAPTDQREEMISKDLAKASFVKANPLYGIAQKVVLDGRETEVRIYAYHEITAIVEPV
jgi:hypothetical protein